MSRTRSWTQLALVALTGVVLGFFAPRLSTAVTGIDPNTLKVPDNKSANPPDEKSAKPPEEQKASNSCNCPKAICTTSDGMRNMAAPCAITCKEGQTADCQCGSCTDSGGISRTSTCRCKAG